MTRADGFWCYRCRAADDEPAGEKCSNPDWHTGQAPDHAAQPPRLPYRDEDHQEQADAQ